MTIEKYNHLKDVIEDLCEARIISEKVFCDLCASINALDNREKYRWHDLRRNPDDLPPNEHEVDIAYKRYNSTYTARAIYEDGTVHSEDSCYAYDDLDEWCEYCEDTDDYIIPRGWIEVTKFAENMGLVDIRVIAWKEIEPFEED